MSLDPFAQLEADVNDAVMRTMANATIAINGVNDIPAIVSAGMENPMLQEPGPAGYSPTVLVQTSQLPTNPAGKVLTVQTGHCAGTYKVSHTEPDGTGLVRLYLN